MTPDELLAYVVKALESLELRYFVTGSIAAMYYGEPRFTNDIDVVVELTEELVPDLVEQFGTSEFYLSEETVRRAVRQRSMFNILHPEGGLKVDIMIPEESLFNRNRFERSRRVRPGQDYEAVFASAEDIILKKMEFFREGGSDKHLRDIASMMKIEGEILDREYIENWAENLGLETIWKSLKQIERSHD